MMTSFGLNVLVAAMQLAMFGYSVFFNSKLRPAEQLICTNTTCCERARTTHSLSLTDDGELFLEHAQRIVSEHAHLDGSLAARAQSVTGTIRISVSQLLGQYVVAPRLA